MRIWCTEIELEVEMSPLFAKLVISIVAAAHMVEKLPQITLNPNPKLWSILFIKTFTSFTTAHSLLFAASLEFSCLATSANVFHSCRWYRAHHAIKVLQRTLYAFCVFLSPCQFYLKSSRQNDIPMSTQMEKCECLSRLLRFYILFWNMSYQKRDMTCQMNWPQRLFRNSFITHRYCLLVLYSLII